jgi:hypothetical protein
MGLEMHLLLKLNKMIARILATILLISPLTSCSNKMEQNNKNFLGKYGGQVNRINNARAKESRKQMQPPALKAEDEPGKSPAQIIGVSGTFQERSAFIDTTKLKLPEKPEPTGPTMRTFLHGKHEQSRVPNIFKVSYELENRPTSYKRKGTTFDDIVIPEHDYFGIKSSLDKKEYDIIDSNVLQENMDHIDNYLTPVNKEINIILLKEREEMRRRKIADLFLGKKLEDLVKADKDLENKEEIERVEETNKTENEQIATNEKDQKPANDGDLPPLPNPF